MIIICVLNALSEHQWLREGGEASDKPIDSAVLSRMKQFRAMNKLKKMALKVIVFMLIFTWVVFLYLMLLREYMCRLLLQTLTRKRSRG